LSTVTVSDEAAFRLERPHVLLLSLYHPEWFPLPRFPLAVSDLARSCRQTLMGQVDLMDMQLGPSLDDLVAAIKDGRPDVVGISATFGQHDLMKGLLDAIYSLHEPPMIVAGGSLTVRNQALLLEEYPRLLIARGPGEPTIADLVGYFHGDLALEQVRGIAYHQPDAEGSTPAVVGAPRRRTPVTPNRWQDDFLPELDLLDATFASHGVAQLEVSRGCTSHCSFCPREHKGGWASSAIDNLPWLLAAIGNIADRHPGISRTLYVVDEEFIGRGDEAVERALAVAGHMHDAGFAWESSCRIDQVVRPDRDRDWHTERGSMWRRLVDLGLRRMLFGVESGVDTILDRFAKGTTAEQNALAIRTLSALGVPTRFTYITFDHLMTADELRASHRFQARTDLLLQPLPTLTVDQIVDGVRDPDFVAEHATGRPFSTEISYMLVSMECLIGAAYTRAVQSEGLAGRADPSMGRLEARYSDWRIGVCSQNAQRWVDRHFALDYLLKSLEKILDGEPRRLLREARVVLKDAAFDLLTGMLGLIDQHSDQLGSGSVPPSQRRALDQAVSALMDQLVQDLAARLSVTIEGVLPSLRPTDAGLLAAAFERWEATEGWHLINANDPCGT
jgi:hypothetical protein